MCVREGQGIDVVRALLLMHRWRSLKCPQVPLPPDIIAAKPAVKTKSYLSQGAAAGPLVKTQCRSSKR